MVQFFAPHEIFRCEGIFMCTYYSVTLTLHSGQAGGQNSWETKIHKRVRQVEQMIGLL